MNNKILSTKRTSAIFLAIVLVTGTIAISLSFMINAHAQPYYNGIDNHNYYKSKDSSNKSVSLNKIKCINDNININGVNSGDVSVGNKGQGYLGANSYGAGYYDGYGNNNKQGKNFDCVINNNNNNNNTNIVVGGGNVTDGGGNVTDECPEAEDIEACFEEFLFVEGQFPTLVAALESGITVEINGEEVTLRSFEDICQALEVLTFEELPDAIFEILVEAGLSPPFDSSIVTCIAEALGPSTPPEDGCEECFTQTLNATQFAALQTALDNGIVTSGLEINSLAELCDLLDSDDPQTLLVLIRVLLQIIGDRDTLDELFSCLNGIPDDGPVTGPIGPELPNIP